MKKSKGAVILAVVLVCLIGLVYYASTIITATGKGDKDGSIKLGLDLSGGVSITYRIVDDNPSQTDINDTVKKLQERAENYSTEYSVYPVGDDRITVEIPGVYDANAVLEELGSPGSLYFITQYDSEGNANYGYGTDADGNYAYVLKKELEELIEDGSVILSGSDVKSANAAYQTDTTLNTNQPVVELVFNDSAAQIFAEATTKAVASGNSIGIYYDDHFISVPTVKTAITDGQCVIDGMSSYEDAETLATFIRVGAINLQLEEMESSVVGASMGSQALASSLKAALIGLVLIMILMIAIYRVSGVAASVALAIYTTIVVALIYLFEITLTLPGIAGIILGIGMAVDANVITFARIREEIAIGKPVGGAIKDGYSKALSAILDGNITTFIAALVLIVLGTGTVKGFAYTLMISIVVSMFTALVIARVVMLALYAVGCRGEQLYGRAKERKPIRFIQHKTIYFVISLVVIACGIISMIVYSATGKGALNYSLEFSGGSSTTIDLGESYSAEDLSIEVLESDVIPVVAEAIGDSEGTIQATIVDGTTRAVLKSNTLSQDEREALESALEENFGAEVTDSQTIGSTISSETRRNAVLAVVVACICMLLYIWFRFKDIRFAAGAIIALAHDVLVVLTAYALIRISVGGTFIACMLTIVGYSINDTIVIFDRIRENMHSVKAETKESLTEVANKSLTQTLGRSINTSITTFVMVLLLFILGVSSIRDFALPLMVGLISGTYTSICIATELWYVMKLHLGRKRIVK